ncbi:hypothetical protein EVAR_29184_1 [Eumeta japonica]|uniref:Uncharacterized protein n=1 Tax=Eumeta variegata TaxID=151549 RepID=A0A4C1VDM9_EUMVA|nr:hypothetical protein EVAR_29184_1 [Eumeta japonica]
MTPFTALLHPHSRDAYLRHAVTCSIQSKANPRSSSSTTNLHPTNLIHNDWRRLADIEHPNKCTVRVSPSRQYGIFGSRAVARKQPRPHIRRRRRLPPKSVREARGAPMKNIANDETRIE